MTSVPVTMFQAIRHLLDPEDESNVLIAMVQAYESHRETTPTQSEPTKDQTGSNPNQLELSYSDTGELLAGDEPVRGMPASAKERAALRMGRGRDKI